MSRPNPYVLTAGFLLFIAVFGGLPLYKGGLYLDAHEGDSYHLLDILLRIDAGLRPHLDFPTPIGFLAFQPISTLIDAGFSAGMAIILSQLIVAFLLLPILVYVCVTRLHGPLAWVFGVMVLGLTLSLSFGGTSTGTSISMHYNRWSWAISFVAIALAVLPAQGKDRLRLDCAAIGVLGGVLALTKITFFVALAPGVLVAVALRWRQQGLLAMALGGMSLAVVVTFFQGVAFWGAYLSDLRLVLGSEVRPSVGVPLGTIIAGAPFLGVTLVGGAAYFLLRQRPDSGAAFAILLLVPGFIYVTFQNFGNDPLWVWLLGVLLFALRPEAGQRFVKGFDLRGLMSGAAIAAFALGVTPAVSHLTSTVRHAGYGAALFVPMLPEARGHQDIFIRNDRAHSMTALVHKDRESAIWSPYSGIAKRGPLTEFEDLTLPHCQWLAGTRASLERMAEDLSDAGVQGGSQLLVADNLSAIWLFGSFAPLDGGAPWYYGNATGLRNVDFLVIPKCALVTRVRGIILKDLAASGARFELLRDNEILALFSVDF